MNKYILSVAVILFLALFIEIKAEGSKQTAPNASITINGTNTTDIAALLINHTQYNRFATYNNTDPNSRLYIHIANPAQECIFMGFSGGHTNQNGASIANLNYEYRIKDPNGNVVFGPITVNVGDQNINTWEEAFIGPAALFGSGGYNAVDASSADLMSQGWTGPGDYYIEFLNTTSSAEVLIDFWDITVATCTGAPDVPKLGRVWSYNWAFFAVNDFGFPVRPFNGSFHVCAPDPEDATKAFITKIDFDGSGFMPAAFNVAFNSFGSSNTGNVAIDRRSAENQNATQSEYAIFLNDPIDLCQTAQAGEIALIGISRCSDEDYCIQFTTSKEGQVDLLLDFDGADNIYTPGSADVLISQMVTGTEVGVPTCISWNGLDGLGMPMDEALTTIIPITIAFAQGIYHFPIYDAEFMTNGFNISAVRPAGPVPQLYYDDSQISLPSGSGETPVQLSGCNLPCHRWTNYIDGNTVGFGNLNTINSWWFSQLVVETELLLLPAYYSCDIQGPDTLCGDGATADLTLDLHLLPIGANNPTIIHQVWSGPGIVGSAGGGQIEIDQEGMYSIEILWINNLGDTCRTSCSKIVIGMEECCALSISCQPTTTWYACEDTIPPPAQNIDQLISAGLLRIEDAECGNLLMTVHTTESNSGCLGDPRQTTYEYELWNDVNDNGVVDGDEVIIPCSQTYMTVDTFLPTIEFTGELGGFQSGDTLYLECQAADPDWTVPVPTVDDVLAFDACTDFTITLSDVIEAAADCAADGYIKLYTCTWLVTDACGNEDNIILYMVLVDRTPPTITEVAPDMTITCLDEIPEPYSQARDACNCAHMHVHVDTTAYHCESDYTLRRTYSWTDNCGNTAQASQDLTVSDGTGINLTLPYDWMNGQTIDVECEHGTMPFWIAELDAHAASGYSPCSEANIAYQFEQLEGSDCSSGYVARYRLEWSATNDCGHLSMSEVFVTLVDNQPPVILSYPTPDCAGNYNPEDIVVEDNCGVANIYISQVSIEATCHNTQSIKYIWNISDHCGNLTYGEYIVHLGDDEAPTLTLQAPYDHAQSGDRVVLPCEAMDNLESLASLAMAHDACDESITVAYTFNQIEPMNCIDGHLGVYRLLWKASDACGNESDFELLAEIRAPDLTNFISDDIQALNCGAESPSLQDNSCIQGIRELNSAISSTCDGQLSFIAYEITGLCGQQVTDTLWMRLTDDEVPVFNELPSSICLDTDLPVARAWDACEQRFIPVAVYERQEDICGLPLTVLSFSAIDHCGNEARHDMTLVPTNLELDFELFYDEIPIRFEHGDWPIFDESCPFDLDESKFRLSPDCPIASLAIDYEILNDNCSNSSIYEYRYYTIKVNSICGLIKEFHLYFVLRDWEAPIFLDMPVDISICADDSYEIPELEFWDRCSDVDVVGEIIPHAMIPGVDIWTELWTAIDACGNQSQYSRVVTNFGAPVISIIAPTAIPCHSLVRLTADVSPIDQHYQYQWHVTQGECIIVNDQSEQAYVDIIMASDSALVVLYVTNDYGCVSMTELMIYCTDKPQITTPFNQASAKTFHSELTVYPNPATDLLHVYSDEIIKGISLYDLRGRQLIKRQLNNNSGSVQVGELNTGLFMLRVELLHGGVEMRKVLVR